MLWTRTLIPTMKESPEGAEIPSHVLMLRAGLVNQVMAGAYTYLPLGLRALKKAERIVREEMDAAGAVEMAMPSMSPRHLWEQTGRVAAFGDVLVQLTLNRTGQKVHVVLGPTHEEIITDMVSRQINSYRQMPITLYQITSKFRNEERPRFGVLRTSEFLMKDAYSFDANVESLHQSYDKMYKAYCKIFTRCGLTYLPVEAESGPIGGDASHEFMIPADNGEDSVLHCAACGYAANQEKAEIGSLDCTPLRSGAETADEGAHAGGEHHRAGQRFLEMQTEQAHQDVDLRGRRPADRRVDSRRSRGERGQDSPRPQSGEARTGHAGSDRKSDRRSGRFRRSGGNEGEDSDFGRPRHPARRQRDHRRERGGNASMSASICTAISSPTCSPICATRSTAIPAPAAVRGWPCGTRSRSATSSSSARSTPNRSMRSSSTPTSSSSRSSWAVTASA